MDTIKITLLAILLNLTLKQGNGQTKIPSTDHNKLSALVGRWTIQGMEDRYLEVCEMYQGGYFLVCNTEFKTKSGGLSKGVSILGYSTEGSYVTYYHYGSSGESQTLKGRIDDEGNLFFDGEEMIKGKVTKTRVTMNKVDTNYKFKEETSVDNGPWTMSTEFLYIRAK